MNEVVNKNLEQESSQSESIFDLLLKKKNALSNSRIENFKKTINTVISRDYNNFDYCFNEAFILIIKQDPRLKNLYIGASSDMTLRKYVDFLRAPEFTKSNQNLIFKVVQKIAEILQQYCGVYNLSPELILNSMISFDGATIGFYGQGLYAIFLKIAQKECNIKIKNIKYQFVVDNLEKILDQKQYTDHPESYIRLLNNKIFGYPQETVKSVKIPRSHNYNVPITGIVGSVQYIADGIDYNLDVDYYIDLVAGRLSKFWARYKSADALKELPDYKIPAIVKYPVQILRTRFYNKCIAAICQLHGVTLRVEDDGYVEDVMGNETIDEAKDDQISRFEKLDNKKFQEVENSKDKQDE